MWNIFSKKKTTHLYFPNTGSRPTFFRGGVWISLHRMEYFRRLHLGVLYVGYALYVDMGVGDRSEVLVWSCSAWWALEHWLALLPFKTHKSFFTALHHPQPSPGHTDTPGWKGCSYFLCLILNRKRETTQEKRSWARSITYYWPIKQRRFIGDESYVVWLFILKAQ